MSLPFLPLLSGNDHTDLQTVYAWINDLIRYFPNAVGVALDPTQGQGGDSALSITEAPSNIVYTPSSSLSIDKILFGAIEITYTLPTRAVGIVIHYKEATETVFKTSFADISPERLIN